MAYNAVHWPFQPPDLAPSDPRRRVNLHQKPDDPNPATRQDYVQMLERADLGVGVLLAALDRHGLAEQTLVIFTNDNGGEWLSRNAPFSHLKATLWEGGIRVPMILRWPGRLPAGITHGQVAMTMDLYPSIVSATSTVSPADYQSDGFNLLPILTGQAIPIERPLFWRLARGEREQKAVRLGRWKLLVDNGSELLFDLSLDPGERADLAARYPDVVATLKGLLAGWEKDVNRNTTSS